MPPRSDEIYIDDDDDDEDEEKDERDEAGNLLIVQDRLFSGAVDWAHLHSVCLKDIRAFDKTAFRPVFA
jgi:hypothetical protein